MIKSLNLALSNKCTAKCVFCPSDRGQRDPGYMSKDLVLKLLDEVTSEGFPWKIKTVQLGENGDALMNPQFPFIVTCIQNHLPRAKLELTTNLVHLKPSWFVTLLRSKAMNTIGLNIDGHNAASYEDQKGIPYKTVMGNLRLLMKYRQEFQPDLRIVINVLPLSYYVKKTRERFGKPPLKVPDLYIQSTFEQVEDSLRKLDWITEDVCIRRSSVFFWAERNMPSKFNAVRRKCPQLLRIEQEAFISPSGLWYPCCLDANQDQAYGSVAEKTLMEIHDSPARLDFIQKLKDRKFNQIGYPCNKVVFCGATK